MSSSFEAPQVSEQSPVPQTLQPAEASERSRLQDLVATAKRRVGHATMVATLAAGSGAAVGVVETVLEPHPQAAAAETGGYPYADVPCYPSSVNSTTGACNNYDWRIPVKNSQGVITSWKEFSERGYAPRNCTDWAAYQGSLLSGRTVPGGLGNAKDWDTNAASVATVDTTPEPGDIAQSEAGTFGHVGVVEDVMKDSSGKITSIDVSQYNEAGTGNYSKANYTPDGNGTFWRDTAHTKKWDHFIDLNGTGKGIGGTPIDAPAPPPGSPTHGKRGDFDGDGRADLAWFEQWKNSVSLLKSNGNSGFQVQSLESGVGGPDWAAVGDFDGNKLEDIAWYEAWKNSITVMINHGGGVMSLQVFMPNIGGPTWAGVGDFDGDGKDDIAWFEQWQNKLTVFRSTGDHLEWWAQKDGLGAPTWAAVGYFNNDNQADIAWYENWKNAVTIFTHNASQSFDLNTWRTGIGGPDWAAAGDFDGDGKDDLAWFEAWKNAITMFHSNGSGFETWGGINGVGGPTWAGVGDFDGDGKEDIAWYEQWKNAVTVLRSNEPGVGFVPQTGINGIGGPNWAGGRNGNFPGSNGK